MEVNPSYFYLLLFLLLIDFLFLFFLDILEIIKLLHQLLDEDKIKEESLKKIIDSSNKEIFKIVKSNPWTSKNTISKIIILKCNN